MASLPQPPVTFTGCCASDLLRSSTNGINGVPLKTLGRARFGTNRDFVVSAKIKKVKKHDYPWPDEIDPNVKGGYVSYLSHFKLLKEKPKPVTLEFEKPLKGLEKKLIDVRKMADDTGLDFSDQITSLEDKYQQVDHNPNIMQSSGAAIYFTTLFAAWKNLILPLTAIHLGTSQIYFDIDYNLADCEQKQAVIQALKDLYTHLTPIQRVNIARHPNRPTFLDHVLNITDKWVELHGDRAGYDDPAIVTGIGSIDGKSYMFMGHQKGRNTKENIQRNFGMPTPHGYRKALRMMYYADHHGFPIITFIDTPGAFADLKSEELGQGEAIAHNLRTMFGLKVPIVSVVIGEGGSGGALAIGCANKLLMLENAVFYVASPEACAAILWKTAKASPKAAEKLKITSTELCKLKIADGVIPEPPGGAHTNPSWTSQQIKIAVVNAMEELLEMSTPKLLEHRNLKFRTLGGFQEGIPVEAEKKANMKKKEEPVTERKKLTDSQSDLDDLADEFEKLKQQILKAKESSSPLPELGLNEMIKKLKKEVDQEYFEAVNSMGLKDRLEMLREEVAKTRSSPDQLIAIGLKDKIKKLKQEFNQGLTEAPNYASLNYKLGMLKELSKAKKISERGDKLERLKREINKELEEVANRSHLKEKVEKLKEEIKESGVATAQDLDPELKEKILKVKLEIESEMCEALKLMNLDVKALVPKELPSRYGEVEELEADEDLKTKIEELNKDIVDEIEGAVSSLDLKNMIETLKLQVAKAGKSPDPDSKNKIEEMKTKIKQMLAEAIDASGLVEKHEKLKQELEEKHEKLKQELDTASESDTVSVQG